MGQRHFLLLLALAGPARAAEDTELASAFDKDDPFDLNIRVGYLREARRAAIKREFQMCDAVDALGHCLPNRGHIGVVKDLRYHQLRNILDLRGEVSIWKDLQIHVEAPLVLGDHRELSFDHKTDGPCITGRQVRPGGDTSDDKATCVDATNSTTVHDGLLRGVAPDGSNYDRETIASENIDQNLGQGLHLPVRSGLDQLYVGIDWGVVNQERDDTKPTWVVGFEWRIPVDAIMQYNPNDPEANTNVGRHVDELVWSTSISKRWKYVEPFMKFWYLLPRAQSDSRFFDYRGGQDKVAPQQQAGTEAGFELIPWQVPEEKQKLSIEVGGAVRAHFEGRGYSEMWELFSKNPALDGPCRPYGSDASLDQVWRHCDKDQDDPTSPDFDGDGRPDGLIRHPGITQIENYLSPGLHGAVRVQMGEWVKFRIGVGMEWDQKHIITFTDGGQDVNGNGRIDQRTGPPEKNPVTHEITRADPRLEVNPIYRPLIDQTGRRYRAEDTFVFNFFASGMLLF
jgi:hypothetical protein